MKIISLPLFIIFILVRCAPPPAAQEPFNYTQEIRIEHDTIGVHMRVKFWEGTATEGRGVILPDDYLVFIDNLLLHPQHGLNFSSYFNYLPGRSFANNNHTATVRLKTGGTISEFPFTFKLLLPASPFPRIIDNKDIKLAVSRMEDGDSVKFVFANSHFAPTYFHYTVKNDSILVRGSDISILKRGQGTYKVYMSWDSRKPLMRDNKKAGILLLKSEIITDKVEVK